MASQPLPRTLQPPPELPNDPKTSDVLSQWLRNFSLWCRHGFADKLSISTAAPGLMLQAYDAPSGTAPPTFMLRVDSAGTLSATQIMMGGANPALGRTSTQIPGLGAPIIIGGNSNYVRVYTADETLNNAVPNGGVLRFDTIDGNSDSVTASPPYDGITIPPGLDGVYIINGWSSTHANQATTMGMGIMVNGARTFSETNQAIYGPNSVDYILDNSAVSILRLKAGDRVQLVNNSVSGGTNAFTSVTMSLARFT